MHKLNEMEMEIYLPIHPFNPTQLINHTQKEKFRSIKKKEIKQIIIINNTRQKERKNVSNNNY